MYYVLYNDDTGRVKTMSEERPPVIPDNFRLLVMPDPPDLEKYEWDENAGCFVEKQWLHSL
jgi:hypothetical protein